MHMEFNDRKMHLSMGFEDKYGERCVTEFTYDLGFRAKEFENEYTCVLDFNSDCETGRISSLSRSGVRSEPLPVRFSSSTARDFRILSEELNDYFSRCRRDIEKVFSLVPREIRFTDPEGTDYCIDAQELFIADLACGGKLPSLAQVRLLDKNLRTILKWHSTISECHCNVCRELVYRELNRESVGAN